MLFAWSAVEKACHAWVSCLCLFFPMAKMNDRLFYRPSERLPLRVSALCWCWEMGWDLVSVLQMLFVKGGDGTIIAVGCCRSDAGSRPPGTLALSRSHVCSAGSEGCGPPGLCQVQLDLPPSCRLGPILRHTSSSCAQSSPARVTWGMSSLWLRQKPLGQSNQTAKFKVKRWAVLSAHHEALANPKASSRVKNWDQ